LPQHYILRFDVSMHNLFRAKQLQAAKELARARGNEAKRKGSSAAHLLQHIQVRPIQW
tara:strand:+ start:944 stop:1117 length:174 start_codon:yes stop_codon:yes gene_type:complete